MMASIAQEFASLKSLFDLNLNNHGRVAQETIDSTIPRLEELVLSLKRHRNQLSPIANLPDDILGAIFVQHSLNANRLFESVKVAAVCKRWRFVALQTPRMWSRIVVTELTPTSLVETVLARSKSTEVAISLDGWVHNGSLDAIRPYCDRIASITLEGDAAFINDLPWTAGPFNQTDDAPQLLPLLKTFIIRSVFTRSVRVDPHSFPSMDLLQTLELHNLPLSLPFPHCPSLKTFRLYFEGAWMGVSKPARRGLCAILARMPLLEILTLVCTELPSATSHHLSEPATTGDTLTLPHLKRLTLHLSAPEVTSLLRCISTDAPLEKLDLHCFADERSYYTSRHLADLIDTLASTRLSTLPTSILSADFSEVLSVKSPAGDGSLLSHHSIRIFDQQRTPLPDRSSGYLASISLTRPVTSSTTSDSDVGDLETFFLGVISAFKTQFQSVVNMATNSGWSAKIWGEIGRLPHLSSLILLSSTPLDALANFLVQKGDDNTTDHTSPFPALERLSVLKSIFRKEGDIIQRLAKGLEDRLQSGEAKLSSIHFEGAKGLSQSDVDALVAVVQEVKVVPFIDENGLAGTSFYLGALDLYY